MKITILGVFPPYRGGIAQFNTLLYQSLKKRHDVSVINFSHQYPNFLFPGKTQMAEGASFDPNFGQRVIDSVNPISWLRALQIIRHQSPDLIIYKYWMPFFAPSLGTISFLSRKHTGIKSLCIIDNLTPHERRPGELMLNRFLLLNTDYFIVMSKTVEEDLLTQKPNAFYKLASHPIYNNFGTQLPKAEARKRLGITEPNVILYFGYIRKYKGIQYLIRAVPGYTEKINAMTIIAGEFYEDKEPYLQEIRKTGKADKIRLIDQYIPDDEVNLYFSAADLVVLPYIHATQSGIMQIALSYGLPCMVTRVGGLPEMVSDGETGFIVPPENPQAIADGIVRFFSLTNRADIEAAVRCQKSRYSWERFTEEIEELVENRS